MKLAILLLFGCVFAFGQDSSPAPETQSQSPTSSSEQQQPSPNNSLGKYGTNMSAGAAIQQTAQAAVASHHTRKLGALDILSDTQGVDFGPYLQDMIQRVRKNWYRRIQPSAQMKRGKLAIEFSVPKDGNVTSMRLVASSGDTELDRAAWSGIVDSNPFPTLPKEFTGPYLALRFRFYYNPSKSDLDGSEDMTPPEPPHTNGTTAPSKSGVTVIIASLGDIYVPSGASRAITATVSGANNQSLEWTVSGLGCSNSACGEMMGNLYLAPSDPPDPPVVTVTAISNADPTAKASVKIHIVQPASAH